MQSIGQLCVSLLEDSSVKGLQARSHVQYGGPLLLQSIGLHYHTLLASHDLCNVKEKKQITMRSL